MVAAVLELKTVPRGKRRRKMTKKRRKASKHYVKWPKPTQYQRKNHIYMPTFLQLWYICICLKKTIFFFRLPYHEGPVKRMQRIQKLQSPRHSTPLFTFNACKGGMSRPGLQYFGSGLISLGAISADELEWWRETDRPTDSNWRPKYETR